MRVYISEGNGRGKCGMCSNPIGKGVLQMVIQGYQTSTRVHLACITKMVEEFYARAEANTVAHIASGGQMEVRRECEHCEGLFPESEMERIPIGQGMAEFYCHECFSECRDTR